VILSSADGVNAWLRSRITPTIAALLLAVMLWILHRELYAINYRDVLNALGDLSTFSLLSALLFTGANYLALASYDQLAFLCLGKHISRWHIVMTAFVMRIQPVDATPITA